MSAVNSKTNGTLEFLNARLDEVRMSPLERLTAKAQLARAEAFADAMFAIARGAKRLLKKVVLRPFRRLTVSIG
jgi:hypothetical protein